MSVATSPKWLNCGTGAKGVNWEVDCNASCDDDVDDDMVGLESSKIPTSGDDSDRVGSWASDDDDDGDGWTLRRTIWDSGSIDEEDEDDLVGVNDEEEDDDGDDVFESWSVVKWSSLGKCSSSRAMQTWW
jgi:hypothetical protein